MMLAAPAPLVPLPTPYAAAHIGPAPICNWYQNRAIDLASFNHLAGAQLVKICLAYQGALSRVVRLPLPPTSPSCDVWQVQDELQQALDQILALANPPPRPIRAAVVFEVPGKQKEVLPAELHLQEGREILLFRFPFPDHSGAMGRLLVNCLNNRLRLTAE